MIPTLFVSDRSYNKLLPDRMKRKTISYCDGLDLVKLLHGKCCTFKTIYFMSQSYSYCRFSSSNRRYELVI